MKSTFAELRAWWVMALPVLVGLAVVAAGYVLLGGLIMGVGAVAGLAVRASRAPGDRLLGGLHLRGRVVDLWLYSVLAVNVVGATLLVALDARIWPLALADGVLLVWGATLVVLEARQENGRNTGATAARPASRG